MYLDYFGLTIKPFQITTDPEFLWLGDKHKEALATLLYGIQDNRGFLLLTGEVGTGKTILINRLISLVSMDAVVATLPDPDLERMDFYNFLADGFKMKRSFDSKGAFLIYLRDFLHQSYADHKQVLLIIDEAQRLNHRLMEDIRMLSNIELQDRKLINIFFVGQPELNTILMMPQNRALAQRITVRYHIECLDQQETGAYVNHRLRVAGSKKPLFKITALNQVYHFSGGIPRLINIICDHALLTAYGKNVRQIDATIIKECAEDLRIPVQKVKSDAGTLRINKEVVRNDASVSIPDSETPHSGQKAEPGKALKAESSHAVTKLLLLWQIACIALVLLLLGALVLIFTQYAKGPEPRYGNTDLTPQKYKTTLEKEKTRLADQLTQTEQSEDRIAVTDQRPKQNAVGVQIAPADKKLDGLQNDQKADQNKPQDGDKIDEIPGKDKPEAAAVPMQPGVGYGIKAESPVAPQIEPLQLMKEKVIIQFNINSNEIEDESYTVLDRIATYLVEHPQQIINVKGYTDSSGSSGYNETVSTFRANAVKSYLIGKGADPEKISIFSMGDANPIGSNETFFGRKKNRRVEIEFIESQSPAN